MKRMAYRSWEAPEAEPLAASAEEQTSLQELRPLLWPLFLLLPWLHST